MQLTQLTNRAREIGVLSIAGLMLLLATATEVQGQRRGRRPAYPTLSMEQANAAWTLEAEGVAKDLKLNRKSTAQLVTVYAENRMEYMNTQETNSSSPVPLTRNDMIDLAVINLKKDLNDFLKDDQAKQAAVVMSLFSVEWDFMVDLVSSYKLSNSKKNKAVTSVNTYIIEYTAAQAMANAISDRQAGMAARRDGKATLDTALTGILNDEQLEAWNTATNPSGQGQQFVPIGT